MKHSKFSQIEIVMTILAVIIVVAFLRIPNPATGDSVLFPVCHNGEPLLVATEAIQAGHQSHGDYLSCEGMCCYMVDNLYVGENMVEADCAAIAGSKYFPNPNSPCFGGGD